jgi:fatty acid desaturase
LRRVSDWRGAGALAWTWGWIAASFAAYALWPHWATAVAGIAVVSGRQLGLAVLMHEGAHRLLFADRRVNDRLSQWLCAYPLLLDTRPYRDIHLRHHKHTWTADDPDLALAEPFPVSRASFVRKLVRDVTGVAGLRRYAALLRALGVRSAAFRGWLVTNAIMAGALWAAGVPEAWLLLWFVPSLTGYSLVLRLRSIAEHAAVTDPAGELTQTRTTLAPAPVRFFVAPHSVGYHLEHHLYPFLPCYRLPQVHRLLHARGALAGADVERGYLATWRRAIAHDIA